MQNERIVKEWIDFSQMDLKTAEHLYATMRPIPLEIICYHCQQSAEKILKAAILAYGGTQVKTHDLGLLFESINRPESNNQIYDACDNLTPYGVKSRYPHELFY